MTDFGAQRHDRHRLIGWFDADRLAATRVAVIGAGAIGNEVCKNLALLGTGRITVFDHDRIERHNLTRSALFRDADVGRHKAEVVAQRTAELDPSIAVDAVRGDVLEVLRPSDVAQFDVVFCCVDNFEARLRLNELALIAGVDLVNGAIDARHASVEHFPFSQGRRLGCYECGLPPSAYQRIAQRYSCGWLRRAGLVERKVPTTIVTSGVAGALMVSWGLRMGQSAPDAGERPASTPGPDTAARRALIDTVTGRSQVSTVLRSDACPACSIIRDEVTVIDWPAAHPLVPTPASAELRLRLPEEVVFGARCESCGFDACGSVPLGSRVRAHTTDVRRCPRCGEEAVAVDGRDATNLGELHRALGGHPPSVPYLWIDDPRISLCVEVKDV
jgi:molybdopterin/thiamine biosynthesis adenylyltransferase